MAPTPRASHAASRKCWKTCWSCWYRRDANPSMVQAARLLVSSLQASRLHHGVRNSSMADSAESDLIVLGAGPGGYAAAFLAADKGMRVTLIDAAEKPGGVCLHV